MAERTPAEDVTLTGKYVRLEPLDHRHLDGLAAAAAVNPSLYRWSPVPQGEAAVAGYIDIAMEWRKVGAAMPFATVRLEDGQIIGSTRLWNLERWAWPSGHPRHGLAAIDGCEIGYTWLTASAIRTAANSEAKLLMLTHAFDNWRALRVCLHTDARNKRSAAAIERIGGKFEGVLRAHRMAADYTVRDSMRFSIVAEEWPAVRHDLSRKLYPPEAERRSGH